MLARLNGSSNYYLMVFYSLNLQIWENLDNNEISHFANLTNANAGEGTQPDAASPSSCNDGLLLRATMCCIRVHAKWLPKGCIILGRQKLQEKKQRSKLAHSSTYCS